MLLYFVPVAKGVHLGSRGHILHSTALRVIKLFKQLQPHFTFPVYLQFHL
jgi:hypothetical protein